MLVLMQTACKCRISVYDENVVAYQLLENEISIGLSVENVVQLQQN